MNLVLSRECRATINQNESYELYQYNSANLNALHIFANPCQDYFLFLAGSSSILLPHKDLSRLYTASAS